MKNEEKAKMIADQCQPCSEDFYCGIYQGVLLALKAEQQSVLEAKKKQYLDLKKELGYQNLIKRKK